MAPYKVVVLPLQTNLMKDHADKYAGALEAMRTKLSEFGLQYKVDESGASIGRRYARADELGIPYSVTIDFDTLGCDGSDPKLMGTATLRDRDTTQQVRLQLGTLPETLNKLCTPHPLCWADLMAAYGDGSAAAASVGGGGDGASAILEYLHGHGVTARLNAAVNALGKAKPADPMAFLIAELQK